MYQTLPWGCLTLTGHINKSCAVFTISDHPYEARGLYQKWDEVNLMSALLAVEKGNSLRHAAEMYIWPSGNESVRELVPVYNISKLFFEEINPICSAPLPLPFNPLYSNSEVHKIDTASYIMYT
jgi:hypothetical protein